MARFLAIGVLVAFLAFCEVECQGYNAVVLEFSPDSGDSPDDSILRNVERYTRYIESAKDSGAAIAVFPEYGLTGFLGEVQDNAYAYSTALPNLDVAPCDYDPTSTNYSKALIDLSCAARTSGIYVVVNLIERALNSSNATIYHNTNIVFNRNGAIIARYRKINLNNERGLTPGDEIVIFSTDFGATFGIFTSDDILYKKPARDVLAFENVTNIVYPTRWTIENPFLTSLSIQAGYATANGLNLLASGLSNVPNGTTGSGFYYYNGTSEAYISSVSTSIVLNASVADLSIRTFPTCNQAAPRTLIGGGLPDISTQSFTKEDLTNYTFSDVYLSNNVSRQTVCSGSYCCNFELSVDAADTSEYYKYAVFYGVREYGYKKTIGTRICALLACESASPSTCGYASKASTQFSSITITGNFANNNDVFDQPLTLLTDYKPLDSSLFSYCPQNVAENSTVTITLSTRGSVQGLRAFGIFGRVYSNDNLETGPRSTAAAMTTFNAISLVILSYIVFLRE